MKTALVYAVFSWVGIALITWQTTWLTALGVVLLTAGFVYQIVVTKEKRNSND